jgi:hypothetical protein
MGMNREIPLLASHEINMVQMLQLTSYRRRLEELLKVAVIFVTAVEK